MSGFVWKIIEDRGEKAAELTGYDGNPGSELIIPEMLDDLPVRRIGRFALEGQQEIRRIRLPRNLRTLSLFAFQNCGQLEQLELYNTTEDYYDGVIRGCTALKDVIVSCVLPDNYIIVRELLGDTDGALRFHLLGKQRIELTFPEYVSEAREDTMARAIHFSIEGAGMAYRECVSKHSLDLAAYDRLLPRLTEYDFEAAADICLGRLRYPVSLGREAAAQYRHYLLTHGDKVLAKEIREQRTEVVGWLCREKLIPSTALAAGVAAAADAGETQICSLLMDYQHSLSASPGGPGRLRLDW